MFRRAHYSSLDDMRIVDIILYFLFFPPSPLLHIYDICVCFPSSEHKNKNNKKNLNTHAVHD